LESNGFLRGAPSCGSRVWQQSRKRPPMMAQAMRTMTVRNTVLSSSMDRTPWLLAFGFGDNTPVRGLVQARYGTQDFQRLRSQRAPEGLLCMFYLAALAALTYDSLLVRLRRTVRGHHRLRLCPRRRWLRDRSRSRLCGKGVAMTQILQFPHPAIAFDPETIKIVSQAFDDAWEKIQKSGSAFAKPAYANAMREEIAAHHRYGRER